LTISPTGGSFTNPYYIFSYGAYWTTPSIFFPLKVSVSSGYTATLTNPNTVARRVILRVGFTNNGGINFATWYSSATYTVPANGTIIIPVPSGSIDYTAIPAATTNTGEAYPTLVYLQLIDVN
jgi:hypothetical protein